MLEPSTECVWGCGRSDFNEEHVVGKQFAKDLSRLEDSDWVSANF
jgi:hypothetical protein